MSKKVVAITGGSGFIGSHLAQAHIKQGDEVRILSRGSGFIEGAYHYKGDLVDSGIENMKILNSFIKDIDVIYHCAGELKNESKMFELHVEGTKRLLKLVKDKECRWVQLSSVGAYGVCTSGIITEKSKENPSGIYEKTKLISDNLVRKSGLPHTILRPSIVFGEKMNNRSLSQMIKIIKYRLFFYLSRDAVANYVHVDDVVSALILCSSHPKAISKTYILSDSSKLETIINSIADALNVKRPKVRKPYFMVIIILKILSKFPKFPLSKQRIRALTNDCHYDATMIKSELEFALSKNLSNAFYKYAELFKK